MTTLTEETLVDLIEVVGTNIQVRTATVIKRGDEEIARSFHRHVLQPGDSLEGQDPRVVAIANAIWV